MGEDLRGNLIRRFNGQAVGVGGTLDGAIHDAWARIPEESLERKPQGFRIAEIVVGGGNPIRWYGVILDTGA